MAHLYRSPDGRHRRMRAGDRLRRAVFHLVALGSIAGVPVATVSLWLLLTNPVVAGQVADTGSVFPIARALLVSLSRAIGQLLALM